MYIPTVIESTGRVERAYDIYSRLLKERIIFIGTEVNDIVANTIIAQMIFLEHDDAEKDIILYINSPGGVVSSGLAIYDTIKHVRPAVQTICVGVAASVAAVLLSAGTTGKRFILPHSRVMLHQPLGMTTGQSSDIQIQAREIIRIKEEMNLILSQSTGRNTKEIEKATDRDFYMNPQEAKDFGLVDKILNPE